MHAPAFGLARPKAYAYRGWKKQNKAPLTFFIPCFARSEKTSYLCKLLGKKIFKVMMIRQLAIIFGCLALGELVIYLTGIKFPSSILGMLILTLFLKLKVIRVEWVKEISEFLVANIGFFFVPPGVAIMLYFDIIKAELWPIVISTVVSTVLVLAVTGWVHQIYGKAAKKKGGAE